MNPSASDRLLDSSAFADPELGAWAGSVLDMWRLSAWIRLEFTDPIELFDFAFEISERLIRSAFSDGERGNIKGGL